MPYKCLKSGNKWLVHKKDSKGKWHVLESSGKHGSLVECNRQVRALYYQESRVKNEDVLELNGTIGDDFTVDYFKYQLANSTQDKLRINISSRGGDYVTALEIYNKLRECGKKVTTSAQGLVASAGAVILLAGDEVEAAANAVIMFHMPQLATTTPMDADKLMDAANNLRAYEDSLIKTISARTGWDEEKCRNFLKNADSLTPEEALDMKLIDRILPFKRKKIDVTDLVLPDKIVAFVDTNNKELETMALKDVCSQFDLQIEDNATEDQLTETLVTHVTKLTERITNLEGELTATRAKLPKERATLPGTLINMVKRSRETEISALVADGKITPVVANELTAIYVTDESIANSVNEKGEVIDSFEKTIDALKKNERVLDFSGKSGTQALPKLTPEDNPLIRDAERRAKGN